MKNITEIQHMCVKLGVPKSGNHELDALIRYSERVRISSLALQGFMANKDADKFSREDMVRICLEYADEFINQIEE